MDISNQMSQKHMPQSKNKHAILSKEILLPAYKLMQMSRLLDKQMLIMLKQGKSYFHIGCMGHEAVQVALGLLLQKKYDWIFPYYRDQALCMTMGMTPRDFLMSFLAKKDDPNAGGRQMPMHFAHKEWNIAPSSSSTGTQFLQAVGCAFAEKRMHGDSKNIPITVVCAGEGTTSQGDFHEALSWAAREKAPILFLIENNGYAISVPIREQRPGSGVFRNAQGYAGLTCYEVDGCDFAASYALMDNVVSDIRAGKGPVLVEAHVVRLLPHSSSDDDKKYRSAEELEHERARDPLTKLRTYITSNAIAAAAELDAVDKQIIDHIRSTQEEVEKLPDPERASVAQHVFSDEAEPELVDPKLDGDDAKGVVLVDAINLALQEEMTRNDKVLVFGQDVARGKGGVFTATRNLTEKFGANRCFNAPLAESSIIGVSIGLALRGFKPVPEIQFSDYVWTAMMQIRNELSTTRYRSNNAFANPVVIRLPVGGYIHGGLCHSQNIEATFAHIPGLKIALPSTALDAYGLLKAAIRCNDPVLFLEHKALYRQNFAKSILPSEDWVLPFGKGIIRKYGEDLTVVTYGALTHRVMQMTRQFDEEGIDIELIDLRTIVPYDSGLVEQSVKKTGKVLVLHEDCSFVGFGAEIAAQIAERCFDYLDAPIKRLAGLNIPVPYQADLEDETLPQARHIEQAIRELAAY